MPKQPPDHPNFFVAATGKRTPPRLRLALLLVTGAALLTGFAVAQTPAEGPAMVNVMARLECSMTSNCVNSTAPGGLPPLRYSGSAEQGMAQLRATLAAFEDAHIESADALSVTAVFTTRMGFRDDVEFVFNPSTQHIHFRSRSRVGLFDFGKNRSRMQMVSDRFAQIAQR